MTKSKKISVYIVFVLVLVISISQLPNYQVNNREQSDSNVFSFLHNSPSYNKSDYINFTGPPIKTAEGISYVHYFRIFIDETNSNHTWEKTAQDNEWLSGQGTYSDPYIIENLYINAEGLGGMINIQNSDKYFIIRNNWFDLTGKYEHDNGILLNFANNGIIGNNTFTYTNTAVNLELECSNIIISDNIMINTNSTSYYNVAIKLDGSDNNTIKENKIRNHDEGINVGNSNNVIIDGNYLEDNIFDDYKGNPIYLREVNNSQVVRNVLVGDFANIGFIVNEISSSGNIFENNQVIMNESWVFGPQTSYIKGFNTPHLQQTSEGLITLEESHNNYIAYNTMFVDSLAGIGISSGEIPGFDPILIVGIISIVSLILLKKRMKK